MSSATPFVSGDVLSGRYELDRRVAQGGFGKVWRATYLVLARPVAIKLLHAGVCDDAETDLYSLGILAYQWPPGRSTHSSGSPLPLAVPRQHAGRKQGSSGSPAAPGGPV